MLFGSLFLLKKFYRLEGQLNYQELILRAYITNPKHLTFFFFRNSNFYTWISLSKKKKSRVHSCLILAESAQLLLGYKKIRVWKTSLLERAFLYNGYSFLMIYCQEWIYCQECMDVATGMI